MILAREFPKIERRWNRVAEEVAATVPAARFMIYRLYETQSEFEREINASLAKALPEMDPVNPVRRLRRLIGSQVNLSAAGALAGRPMRLNPDTHSSHTTMGLDFTD